MLQSAIPRNGLRRASWSLAFLAAIVTQIATTAIPTSRAEGPKLPEKGGVFPDVTDVSDEAAGPLVDALEAAVKSRKVEELKTALAPMVKGKNEKFSESLKRLIVHDDQEVACLAVSALASQGDKTASTMISKYLTAKRTPEEKKGNFWMRGKVRAACIEALGRLGVTTLHDLIRTDADAIIGAEAEVTYAPEMLRACVRYFGLTKEKRAVGFLVEEFDMPESPEVVTGTTPPAEWWKARTESWRAAEKEIVWALKEITGLEHETGRRWKNWFKENAKKLGYK
jgi:hypothetical protein